MPHGMQLLEKFTTKHEKDRIKSNQFALGFSQIYLLSTAISESIEHIIKTINKGLPQKCYSNQKVQTLKCKKIIRNMNLNKFR